MTSEAKHKPELANVSTDELLKVLDILIASGLGAKATKDVIREILAERLL